METCQRVEARLTASVEAAFCVMLIPRAAHCSALHIRRVATKQRVSAAALTQPAPLCGSDALLDGCAAACLPLADKWLRVCLPTCR